MITRTVTTLFIVTASVFASSASASILIDNYTVGSTIAQFMAGTTSQTTNHSSILGGSRDATLTVPDLSGDEFFGVMGFGGALQLAQGSQDEIQGSLVYDNFTPIDFTEAGMNNKFVLRVSASDAISAMTGAFSMTIGSGGFSSTVAFDIPANLPGHAIVNFSEFSGVDFTTVDSVELAFNLENYPGVDLTIDRFFASRAIPEPASVALLTGLALFLVRRRQRRG